MADNSGGTEFEALFGALPVDLRRRFQSFVLENMCLIRALDAKYFAKCAEIEGAELLAAIGEYALARFDLLAYHVVRLFSYHVDANALEAPPAVQERLTELISQTLSFTRPTFEKLGPVRAMELRSELHLKLLAKQQACLIVVERKLASGNNSDVDFLTFSRIIAQSPMKSRADWWTQAPLVAFENNSSQDELATARGRRAVEFDPDLNQLVDPMAYQMETPDASAEGAPTPVGGATDDRKKRAVDEQRSALADNRTERPRLSKRAKWLSQQLLERGWSASDPYAHGGPDRKTIEKILRGESVRNDVLKKLADSLSASREGSIVKVLDIPEE